MSSCESALAGALVRPVDGLVPVAALTWMVTGAWPRPVMRFDVAHARPSWWDPLDL